MAISIKTGEISALRRKLHAERKLLEERERAVTVVEQMLREEAGGKKPSLPLILRRQTGTTFKDKVKNAVSSSDQEFTVADIETILKASGVPLPKINPRSRIAMIVQELHEGHEIERTFEGSGRNPHRYKVKR